MIPFILSCNTSHIVRQGDHLSNQQKITPAWESKNRHHNKYTVPRGMYERSTVPSRIKAKTKKSYIQVLQVLSNSHNSLFGVNRCHMLLMAEDCILALPQMDERPLYKAWQHRQGMARNHIECSLWDLSIPRDFLFVLKISSAFSCSGIVPVSSMAQDSLYKPHILTSSQSGNISLFVEGSYLNCSPTTDTTLPDWRKFNQSVLRI